jgi:hypothetical protein
MSTTGSRIAIFDDAYSGIQYGEDWWSDPNDDFGLYRLAHFTERDGAAFVVKFTGIYRITRFEEY